MDEDEDQSASIQGHLPCHKLVPVAALRAGDRPSMVAATIFQEEVQVSAEQTVELVEGPVYASCLLKLVGLGECRNKS